MNFSARIVFGISVLLIIGWVANSYAAPTVEQRTAERRMYNLMLKAGNLYKSGKLDECAKVVKQVQGEFKEAIKDADKPTQQLFSRVYNSMKRAHALLELEGVELEAIPSIEKLAGAGGDTPEPIGNAGVSFVNQVVPILTAKCGNCHIRNARGMFSMSDYETLMKGPAEGVVVFPKDADGSRIVEVIVEGDMPRGGLKVADEELAILKKWISEGAKFDGEDPKASLSSLNPDVTIGDLPMVELTKATGDETVRFSRDIAPIFVENCVGCHGAGQRPSGRLDINRFSAMLRGGESGPSVLPGKAEESLLIKKLLGTGGGQRMPLRKDPLSDAQMKLITTWISEGATFDARDGNQPLTEVVAIAKAEDATHEELSADRSILSEKNWKLAMSGLTHQQAESKSFLVVGSLSESQLSKIADAGEVVASKISVALKADKSTPLIKGRMTLFVFNKRYDYGEFGTMVEKRSLPRDWKGHWKYSIVDAYGTILNPSSEEYTIDGLIAEQLAGVYISTLGDLPDWFSEGVGRAIAQRIVKDDARIEKWDDQIGAAIKGMAKSTDFMNGKLSPEDSALVAYSYVKSMMSNKQKFDQLLGQLRKGSNLEDACVTVYGGTPEQLSDIWWQTASR